MEDQKIVELYWERSEKAILHTQEKYGRYCHSIAFNVLNSDEDAEECVNDTYVKAWESMPPHRPERLSTFLGKLTRGIAINRYIHNHAQKRSKGTELILEEVAELIPDPDSERPMSDELALRQAINGFMATLPESTRILFVRRYWYMSAVRDIARDMGMTQSNVKVTLMRTRSKFKAYLEKEGITV